jgi:hypothetical protein
MIMFTTVSPAFGNTLLAEVVCHLFKYFEVEPTGQGHNKRND